MNIEPWNGRRISVPGAYRIDPAAYHADPVAQPSLSNSVAQILLAQSPLHAWTAHPRLNPDARREAGTRRTALGEAVHRMVLGRGAEIELIDAHEFRTNAAKEARDAAVAAGKIAMAGQRNPKKPDEPSEYEQAETISNAAREQLAGFGIPDIASEGDSEVAVFAEEGGVWTRQLIDWWSPDRLTMLDLKTTNSASPDAFAIKCAQMGYDVQDAFYLRGLGKAFPELAGRARFLFAAVEIEPPYAMTVCEIAQSDRFVADRKVEQALSTWAECLRANQWPGYKRGITTINLPDWHSRKFLEQELVASESGERSAQWEFARKGGE